MAERPRLDDRRPRLDLPGPRRPGGRALPRDAAILARGLPGTVLDERDFAMHVATVDRKSVKAALSSMLTWSKKNRWDGFVPAVRALRDDAARKTDSPHRTYGQVVDALLALRRAAEEALEEEREDSDSDSDSDSDAEGGPRPRAAFPRGPRAVWEKWAENALPDPNPPGGGDAHGFGSDAGALGGPESPGSRGRARRAAVGGKGLRRDGDAKRPRYEDPATDDEFEDEDRGDGSAHDERKRRKAAASERPTSTHVVGGSARVAFEIDGGGSGGFGSGSGLGPAPTRGDARGVDPRRGQRDRAVPRSPRDRDASPRRRRGREPEPAATRPDPPPPRGVSRRRVTLLQERLGIGPRNGRRAGGPSRRVETFPRGGRHLRFVPDQGRAVGGGPERAVRAPRREDVAV